MAVHPASTGLKYIKAVTLGILVLAQTMRGETIHSVTKTVVNKDRLREEFNLPSKIFVIEDYRLKRNANLPAKVHHV